MKPAVYLMIGLMGGLPLVADSPDEAPQAGDRPERAEPSEDLRPSPPGREASPAPWIGLEVAKLTEAMRAHVSDVPEGVGFVVTSVEEGGPAEAAGLRRFDILWRFEDQLLINEAQFGTLIRMKSPGDEVGITFHRAGKPEKVTLKLGETPKGRRQGELDPTEIPIYPSGVPGMPRQVVYPKDRTAEITRHDGSVVRLRYESDEAMVRIEDSEGVVLFDGPLKKDGRFAVPDEWRCTVGALLRTLHRSKHKDWRPREPRPRVVTPPKPERDEG